jgi:hypothetical protein
VPATRWSSVGATSGMLATWPRSWPRAMLGPLIRKETRVTWSYTIVLFESTRKLGHRGLIAQNPRLTGKLNAHCRSPLNHGKLLN